MTVDWSRTLLLWDPRDKADFGLEPADFDSLGIRTLEVPYDRLGKDSRIADAIKATNADAIIFTRNERMENDLAIGSMLGKLRMGYTCASAIDRQHQVDQTRQCIADLLSGNAHVPIPATSPPALPSGGHGTGLSLIFDLEQLGGARFGMPRLLPLLESFGVRATFFVTGIIVALYPGLMRRIADGGHEIGIHGEVHEFLQARSQEEQSAGMRRQVQELQLYGDVKGVNYIYRMDGLSPAAVAAAGLQYLVLFRKHSFYRTRYMPQSSRPRTLRTRAGDIAFLPIGVETYGRQRPEIVAMVDSCLNQAARDGGRHISILMHPFRDGSLECLEDTQWLIRYLVRDRRLRPLVLADVPRPSSPDAGAVQIAYRWDGYEATADRQPTETSLTPEWWEPPIYHSRRTENLADAFDSLGVPATLATECQDDARKVCVYPDSWQTDYGQVSKDPILNPMRTAQEIVKRLDAGDMVAVVPGSPLKDLFRFFQFHIPRNLNDLARLAARLPRKVARLLSSPRGH